MEIITGYTGKPHVTSEQDRDVNIGVVGEGSYVLRTGMQLAAEVSSNNEIKIRDGVLMHQGCTASIKKNTYDSLTITNGSQGMKRVDLIVARYEKNQDNGIESLDLKVIQGTPAESNPAAPQYTEGDIQAGDYVADMPMYQVIIEGLNITEVKKMFKVIGSNKNLSDKVAELNENITSVKSVNKNITKMIAGSKVVNAKASTSVQVFTNSEINKALGVTNSSNANTVVLMTNGDGLAQKVHVEGSTYLNSAWHATFNQDASAGSIRINYVIFYFGYGAVTVE
ncbi:hypothetical protein G4359_00700 [Dorea longicatena]|uniref:hypothetical protein n=1 Tax=Dorea longicatena TaxID=88431 RepID=UPI00156E0018|nr:hypothetical protein [Dorea longicatena]NSC48733.1 hypothetical protein [Dorea longicatena]NSD24878.1 hypothetical protein [Dorea longicatena]NSD40497.1 hypothetical protein [Dorea longicatena]NSD69448.1 hypothetical protein [Dorea longicatena]NSD72412.1 hypothetical protein [Dorea longicatena]